MSEGRVAQDAAPGVDAVINADGELAAFVPALEARPLRCALEGGGMVRVTLGSGKDSFVGLPPEALDALTRSGRMLMVEVSSEGAASRETWVGLAAETGP